MADEDLRRPFVTFETVPVEDRQASQGGVMAYKDVDFINITPHGSEGKTVLHERYEDWIAKMELQCGPVRAHGGDPGTPFIMDSRFPRAWLDQIKEGYIAWKKGEELPVEGTPLKQWAALPPAMLQNCLANHIFTIEQLAAASDEAINPIGMGARMYRNRAVDWVKLNKESERNKIVQEVNLLREDRARMEGQLAAQARQIAELAARIPNTDTTKMMQDHLARQTA